jgi:hypothetical protein
MARRSLSAFPFIAQLLDVEVDLGSVVPGTFAETAQASTWPLGFRPENDVDSGNSTGKRTDSSSVAAAIDRKPASIAQLP